jgi:uncharacterized membrane protein (DUF485 family)
MFLMVIINELFLGLDHYLAHLISGTIRAQEAIPIYFGVISGTILIILFIIGFRKRDLAAVLASVVLLLSIAVGITGWVFHFMRAFLENAPAGQRISIQLLVWAPPIIAPLTSSQMGLLGIIAIWREDPADGGYLRLNGNRHFNVLFSKTRIYFMLVGLGILATFMSSTLDHARTAFENPWLWVPVAAGVFGAYMGIALGVMQKPSRGDLIAFTTAMLLLIVVGVTGSWLHVMEDWADGGRAFVLDKFLAEAPFLAPLLFCDMGMLGLVAMMDPKGSGIDGKVP